MHELAREFVRRRAERRQAGVGFRVAGDLRRLAVRFGRWALEDGLSLAAAAERLGVSWATLRRWLEETPPEEVPVLREVVVAVPAAGEPAGGAGSRLALVTPGGLRIEGLTRADVVELLGALR
jgi:hypothetical protein